jgi:hypothetical protein
MSARARSVLPRLPLLALALLLPLLLQGCWTLEQYVARVRVEADGSYKYVLEGSALHTATQYALRRVEREAKAGAIKGDELKKQKQEAEAGMTKDLETARLDPRVASATPVGEGRVRFTVAGRGSIAGGELIFSERTTPLSYARAPEGALSVRLKDAVVSREAEALHVSVGGDVSVILAEGIQVLGHNAQKTPTVPGGAYRWHVEKPGESAPYLLLRLPERAPAR